MQASSPKHNASPAEEERRKREELEELLQKAQDSAAAGPGGRGGRGVGSRSLKAAPQNAQEEIELLKKDLDAERKKAGAPWGFLRVQTRAVAGFAARRPPS